jgi:hypothetical protein
VTMGARVRPCWTAAVNVVALVDVIII